MIDEHFRVHGSAATLSEQTQKKYRYLKRFRNMIDEPNGLGSLKALWDLIGKKSLNVFELMNVLENTELAISNHMPASEGVRKYVVDHVGAWTNPAIPLLPKFNHYQLSKTLLIMAKLKAPPDYLFMEEWKACAANEDNIWDSEDVRRLNFAERSLGIAVPMRIKARQIPPMAAEYLLH